MGISGSPVSQTEKKVEKLSYFETSPLLVPWRIACPGHSLRQVKDPGMNLARSKECCA